MNQLSFRIFSECQKLITQGNLAVWIWMIMSSMHCFRWILLLHQALFTPLESLWGQLKHCPSLLCSHHLAPLQSWDTSVHTNQLHIDSSDNNKFHAGSLRYVVALCRNKREDLHWMTFTMKHTYSEFLSDTPCKDQSFFCWLCVRLQPKCTFNLVKTYTPNTYQQNVTHLHSHETMVHNMMQQVQTKRLNAVTKS